MSFFSNSRYPFRVCKFPSLSDVGIEIGTIYKGHLHRLRQEIRRRHPQVSGVWKLEFQKRQAAHFHFLLIGCTEDLTSFRRWIAHTWARIVDSGDPKHLHAGTGVDFIRTYGGVMAYVTSYIGKDDQTLPGNFTGRYWGVMNRAHLPVAEATVYEVSDEAAEKLNRWKRTLARKYQEHSRFNKWNSMRRKVPGSHMCLSRLEFAYAWSRRKHRQGQDKHCFLVPAAGGGFIMPWSALTPEMSNGSKLRPPRKVKVWNNSGGALLCDASGFWNAVQRGMQQDLL